MIDPDWPETYNGRMCSCNRRGASHPLRHEGFCRPRVWQRVLRRLRSRFL